MIKAVIFDLWGTLVEKNSNGKLEIAPGALEILKELSENNIEIGLATSMGKDNAREILKEFQIADFFTKETFGTEVLSQKPDPEIFLKTADRLGFLPEDCLIIEDGETTVKEAQKVGFHVILRKRGDNLKNLVDYFLKDIE